MFYLYLQSSSASRQPKISNLMFFANPVYRVRSHPNAWHLTVQWHGWTRSSKNSIFLSEIYQFFVGKYSTFILPSSSSRKWKNSDVVRFADLVHKVRRDPSVTLRKFHWTRSSNNQTSSSLIFFHISLWKIFYLHLEPLSASRKWKHLNVVLFTDSVQSTKRSKRDT